MFVSKSVHKERIIDNFNIFDFERNQDDMDKIAAIDNNTSYFFSHRDPEIAQWIGSRKLDI